ncbi:DapH/DapD/GlmU-related protein [Anaerolineales bacterium HSG24]|nr:DapH/DapD/GlmU-related protein [Anaerolineales bacterium HSG24]
MNFTNNIKQLASYTSLERQDFLQRLVDNGVVIIDLLTVYVTPDIDVEPGTIILPNSYLLGNTKVGKDCIIGPSSFISDTNIGDNCSIIFSVLEKAIVGNGVEIGPFAHLRKGAHLDDYVHMGNFGEIKNSYLASGTKMGHFSYIGDAVIGEGVNIGAGTITCNYDGTKKHSTKIGKNSFIGSDTMLVAPLDIGQNARTGAGSVVTKNIPDDTLVIGVPARQKTESSAKTGKE